MPNRLTNLEIVEVSFVDKPANVESRVELFKRDTTGEEFELEKSNPVSEDVMEPEVLGTKKRKKKAKKSEGEEQKVVKATETSYPAGGGIDKEERHMPDDETPEVELTEEQEQYVSTLENKVMDLEDAVTKANATIAELQEEEAPEEEEILKSAEPEVVELVKAAQAEAEEAKGIAKAEREARIRKEMEDKAGEFAALTIEKSELADFLYSAGENLPEEDVAKLHTMLAAANEAAAVGKLFEEAGAGGPGPTEVEGVIEKKAAVIKADNPEMTEEQAYDQALTENPELYDEVVNEGRSS